MQNRYRFFSFIFIMQSIFLSLPPLIATDLTPGGVLNPNAFLFLGDSSAVSFTVNNDSTAAADRYDMFVVLRDPTGGLVFEEKLEGGNLAPRTSDTLTTSIKWRPLLAGRYDLELRVDYRFEVLPGNDTKNFELKALITRQAASGIFNNLRSIRHPDLRDDWAFMPQEPLAPGDLIASKNPTELNLSMTEFTWITWHDFERNNRFLHPATIYRIDAITEETTIDSINWYPVINDTSYLADFETRINSEDRIHGDPPPEISVTTPLTLADSSVATAADSVCAILISGEIETDSERSSFTSDLEFMEKNLMHETLGPGLPSSQIVRIGNATKGEVLDAIRATRGAYNKIYFYYTGHGYKGGMVTNGPSSEWLSYIDLADELYKTNAGELCVVLDACYAGSAEFGFRVQLDFETTNLTLVGSSMSTKTSKSRRILTTSDGMHINPGAFSWAFVNCFGDPEAESDGLAGISFREAYEWVRVQNPSLNDGPMNVVMNPVMVINRYQPPPAPDNSPLPVPEVDTEVSTELEFGVSARMRLGLSYGFPLFPELKDDQAIIDLPAERYFEFDLKEEDEYKLSVGFKYRPDFDRLDLSLGTPGLARRDSAGGPWRAYAPTEWDSTTGTVHAFDIKSAGHFAFATVDGAGVVAVNDQIHLPAAIALRQNYPNPFNPETIIRYSLRTDATVHLGVYDIRGKLIRTLLDARQQSGSYTLQWDGRNDAHGLVASGIYFYRLSSEGVTKTRKMTLIR